MFARRLPRLALLAVSIAVLVHVAAFGFEHVPGGNRAPEFAGLLGAAGLLCMLAAFFGAALRPPERPGRAAAPIATVRRHDYADTARLAGLALAAYGLIELCEGHFALAGTLRALAFALPAAAAVGWLARRFGSLTRAAGSRFADFAQTRPVRAAQAVRLRPAPSPTPRSCALVATRSGRAPPAFA